jgi:hypothetical protein
MNLFIHSHLHLAALLLKCRNQIKKFQARRFSVMNQGNLQKTFGLFLILFFTSLSIFAQGANSSQVKAQEISDDGTPVILKHLPDWENVRGQAVHISNSEELRQALGERPIFSLISFEGGNEAATANYAAGKLLIVEYASPQLSVEADNSFKQFMAENPPASPVYFRRVGNYEVFVFDGGDEAAANQLIDQVKYEKTVQWLGENPYLRERAEKAYVQMFSGVFLATIVSIFLGLSLSVCLGIGVGMLVFYIRKQKQATMTAFSDAGGMTRLNLDELTPDIKTDKLLRD